MTDGMNTCKLTECQGKPRCMYCTQMDKAFGPPGKAEELSRLRAENERLRDVLDAWSQDGRLQSYNDRERFREAARSVLADA